MSPVIRIIDDSYEGCIPPGADLVTWCRLCDGAHAEEPDETRDLGPLVVRGDRGPLVLYGFDEMGQFICTKHGEQFQAYGFWAEEYPEMLGKAIEEYRRRFVETGGFHPDDVWDEIRNVKTGELLPGLGRIRRLDRAIRDVGLDPCTLTIDLLDEVTS